MDPRLLTNRYEIVRSLGTGAVTAVFEARHRPTGVRVAIKVPIGRFKDDKTLLVRLEREVAALGGFHHPNVATIHAVERHGGSGFVLTELVDAPSLRQVLAARGRLSPARAARAAAGICAALASAHARGIVHGHLTLDNVLVTGDGWVKVTDFRLAEAARPFARAPDPAADLRALGRCLATMLTGNEPAGRGPALLGPEVPAELAAIVRRATGNPPDSDYSSAAEVGRDLDRFLATVHHSIPPLDGSAAAATRGSNGSVAATPDATAELGPIPTRSSVPRGRRGAGVTRRRRAVVAACLVGTALVISGSVVAAQRLGGSPEVVDAGPAAPPLAAAAPTPTTGRPPATTGLPTTTGPAAAPAAAAPTTSPTPTTAQRPAARAIPDVVGLHRQQASSLLARAGLRARVSLVPVNGAGRVQRVIAQQPAAGTVVPRGSVVTLEVGSRKPGG